MSTPILNVEQLQKRYGSHQHPVIALRTISFDLAEGEILALVGESGSGKSTVAKILCAIEAANSGRVTLDGQPLSRLSRQAIQLVFQDPYSALNPFNTVEYVLSRPLLNFARLRPAAVRGEVLRLLNLVRLTPPDAFLSKRPHELSGGQRQRVLIARALACRPEVIIADEPVSMLDVSIRAEILALLHDLREKQTVKAIIYITHDIASARMVADRIVVLYRGKIVESGPIDAIFHQPSHPYTQLLLRVIPRVDQDLPTLEETTSTVSSEVAPSTGCPFLTRCGQAVERCNSEDPPLVKVQTQWAACHLVSPTAPQKSARDGGG